MSFFAVLCVMDNDITGCEFDDVELPDEDDLVEERFALYVNASIWPVVIGKYPKSLLHLRGGIPFPIVSSHWKRLHPWARGRDRGYNFSNIIILKYAFLYT